MKSKDYYYALIAISALGVMSQTFDLFNEYINRVLIAGGIAALAVFYLFELKNVRKEHKKRRAINSGNISIWLVKIQHL
ncbi:MAG: hypothetical protein GYA50_01420 [Eubacteriaceae bacterium]|nr:hypothetical protein [Eubacteriaceae bacterium]